MLYYKFQNFQEFKELFGIQKHQNGSKSRKNKILLSLMKDRNILHQAIKNNDYSLISITSMSELKQTITQKIIESGDLNTDLPYELKLMGKTYYSSIYSTDEYKGVCEDHDYKAIRYYNHSNQQIFKMKAGKLFRSLALETQFGKSLPPQVLTYLIEEFVQDWQIYAMGTIPENILYVNQDFERIYNGDKCKGCFNSCMEDKDNYYFYTNSVNASAAYLEDAEGMIIARCIIFNEVTDKEGKIWKLAERQYATEGNSVLQRLLIDKLIKENKIDGYKKVGAGCSDAREFVDNSGNSLYQKQFKIDCDLDFEQALSYQDSFKYYDMTNNVAYNYPNSSYDYLLDITDGELPTNDDEYDSYHDYYCTEIVSVNVHGHTEYCDIDNLDDFTRYNNQWYHHEDVNICPMCDEQYLVTDEEYSSITETSYCCISCLEEAEAEYEEENNNNQTTNEAEENAA